MAPRTLNRPRPRSPSHKENVEDEPGYKKRHVTSQKLATHVPRNPSRSRQPMSELNSTPDSTPGDAPVCPDGADKVEFASREDVERLLNEKMKGKGKSDFKGKCDQMMEYIKRLRSCIKWFEELEDGYLLEREKLRESIEVEKARCAEMESLKKRIEDALNAKLEELKIKCDVLQDKLEKEECGRLIAMESHDQEKEARKAAEASINALNTDMQKALQEVKDVKQQIKSIEDINKRLQEYNTSLQHYNSRLQNDAAAQNEANAKLQKEKSSMMEALSSLRSHSNLLQEQLNSSKTCQQDAIREKEELKGTLECLRAELQHVRNDRNLQIESVQTLKAELADFKERAQKTLLDLEMLISKTDVLEGTCSSQRDQINKLQSQLDSANAKLQMADSSVLETTMVYEEQKKEVRDLKSRLAEAELKIIDGEILRKKLHNTIQELKGNIRVFCRVRPLFHDHDFSGTESSAVSYPTLAESLGRGIDLLHNNKKHSFTFDKVFDHEASQQDIFVEISQLVQSALDGYKVCIFAYGQTGSGKTYTMMGKQESPELRGLIPRSLEQIFQTSQSLSSHGWAFKMQASMLEIYNETLRDLLVANRTNCPDATSVCGKQYTIKHDRNGNTHVSDLTVVDVSSLKEVSYLLKEAGQSRSIGRTQMNEQSSRSHFVFILRISGVNENTGQLVHGVLNLIDLAGSERLDKSGATGDRLKETQHINKSLLSLSDVISAIAKKEEHIPFRNSKLTFLLQPCLGGESKTLMFVNISPESSSTGESKCSLQFASKVNSCEIGVAHRNAQTRYTD